MAHGQLDRSIQFNLMPGFLIAHREYMANMEAHTLGFELIYSSNFTRWAQSDTNYRHLRWGTGISYFNLGDKQLNGDVYAWHIHVEANLKKRKHFQSTLRFGSGIGYLTKPYDLISNRKNKAIGSHLNGNIQLMYKAHFDVSNSLSLITGIGITHYSNGNFKRPNLGINLAHFVFGFNKKIKTYNQIDFKPLPKLFPDNGIEFNVGIANKEISVADTRRFTIITTSLLHYFKYNETRNWRAGLDVYFDKTYPYFKFQPSSLDNVKLSKQTEIALKVGHEFIFGRLAIVSDLGTYLYRPNQYKKAVYFSIGFNYFFNKNINLQTRLKSHLAVADYFQWNAGYRFKSPFYQ